MLDQECLFELTHKKFLYHLLITETKLIKLSLKNKII